MEAKTETEAGTPRAAPRRASATLRQRFVQWAPFARGLRDLWQGWRDYRELWISTGWYDIRKRYRRSLLGPFWITISLGAFIAGLSFIYMPLVGGNAENYLPYLAFGFVAWQLISNLVIEGCNVFIANGPIIQQLRAPLSIYIYQMVWRHLIILAHNSLDLCRRRRVHRPVADLANLARHSRASSWSASTASRSACCSERCARVSATSRRSSPPSPR